MGAHNSNNTLLLSFVGPLNRIEAGDCVFETSDQYSSLLYHFAFWRTPQRDNVFLMTHHHANAQPMVDINEKEPHFRSIGPFYCVTGVLFASIWSTDVN